MADTKWSQFPSQTPGNSDEVVGLHSGGNARFTIANIVAAVRNGLASIFVPQTRTINNKALSSNITLDASDVTYDNTQSGLTATDVQAAIDEVVGDLVTPTSEQIGSGHTLIRCGKLRILKVGGFYAGSAVITIPVADRPTFATSGVATYNDNSEAYMTFGLVIVNTDGSIAYKSWNSYNTGASLSNITNRWVNCPGVIWMTA